jgi:hypothetical protein
MLTYTTLKKANQGTGSVHKCQWHRCQEYLQAYPLTNAGSKGSPLGQKQTPKRGCFPRCWPSWKPGLLRWQGKHSVNGGARSQVDPG